MADPQCVLLHDVLYVGGGHTLPANDAKLFISKNVTEHLVWDVCHTPTERYALTTYHSQLVLVGGREPSTLEPSNMLWKLSSDARMKWEPSIQEMPTKRWGASAMNTETPEYLVVAGGVGVHDPQLDAVEVFTGKEWCIVEPLPKPYVYLKWALHKGKYYLCGGYPHNNFMYYCDLKLLLKSCEQSGGNKTPFLLWNQFQVTQLVRSAPASFGQHLISVGGVPQFSDRGRISPNIIALSPLSQKWVLVGKLPIALQSAASIVLRSGELVVLGEDTGISRECTRVFKATLRGEAH